MSIRRSSGIVLFSLLMSLAVIGLMGCADSDTTSEVDEQAALRGENSSFFGGLLKQVLSGVISGAEGKPGSEAMGLVLSLLGFGEESDQPALDAMSGKLDQIVSILGDIKKDLDALMQQLKITEGEILANTNDPSDAITQIKSSHQELQGLSDNKAGSGEKQALADFTNRVENVYNIYSQVNSIHDAILPSTVAKAPVLKNFFDLALNKGNSLTNTYLGVEKYFSQLLYYQMEGVNLIVETKKYREKAGLPQIDGRDAKAYMDFFTAQILSPEVEDFMTNISEMIFNHANLLESNKFLPSESPAILARANFFRIQALNLDHFGLRGTLLATQDLVPGILSLKASEKGSSQAFTGQGDISSISATNYDFWIKDGVKGSSDYTLILYDFGDAPVGQYEVKDDSGELVGTVDVKMYNDDYTVPADGSGTINYGHVTVAKRVGAKDAFNNNPTWKLKWNTDDNTTVWGNTGDVKNVKVATNNKQLNYSNYGQLDATFQFLEGDPATINYSMHVSGETTSYVYSATGDSESTIHYRVGLMDGTTGAIVHEFDSDSKTASASNYQDDQTRSVTKTIEKDITGSFLFGNPTVGHSYYVFFYVSINGSKGSGTADEEGRLEIKDIDIYVSF
ncbi:hypothetical protein GW871_10335 [bacterium]|nr:hypothetical protein [bacterium]